MNVKLKLPVWIDQDRGLNILVFNLLPSILAFFNPLKNFKLFEQLSDRWHDRSKLFYEALIKMGYPIKNLNFLGVVGTSMFTKASTLLGSMTLPSLDVMNPKMILENTMNAHLSRFKLIPNSLHLRNHFFSFSRWVDRSPKMVKLSRKIFMNASIYSWKVLVTTFW